MQGASRTSLAATRDRLRVTLSREAGPSEDAGLAQLGEELFTVLRLLDREHALRRALADPSPSPDRRSALLRSALDGKVSGATLDLLDGVVRARWSRSADLADAVEVAAVLTEAARAEREGYLDELEDELFRFGRIVDGQPSLRTALADRALPPDRKRELLRSLLADRATPGTLRLVSEVAAHPRGRTFDRGLGVCTGLVAEWRGRLIAVVRTAVPLSADERLRLANALARTYGHEVNLNIEVDPDVVGGLSVRIGNEVLDGTLARRVDYVRRRLAG
ncbi:MAG: F0F1 ATP synthase subunit delta [Streptomycetales bacterium]